MGGIPPSGDSRGISQMAVSTVFLLLATLAVIARIWARRIKSCELSINDYATFVALVSLYGMYGVLTAMVVAAGQGQHQANVSRPDVRLLLQLLIAVEVTWALCCSAVKISILHLYTGIFHTKMFRQACYGLMVLTGIFASIVILIALLLCRPLSHFWDRAAAGTCGYQAVAFLSSGVLNLIIDLMVIILPMRNLWRLQLTLSRKISVMIIFGIGAAICIVSAARLPFLWNIKENDVTWSNEPSGLFTFLEPALSVVNTCLPVLQPVVDKIFRLLGIRRSNHGTNLWNKSSSRGKSNASEGRSFKRLDDQAYPLTRHTGNCSIITSPNTKEIPDPYKLEEPESIYPQDPRSTGIKVKNEWEIKPTTGASSKSLFGNVSKDWENDPSAGMPLPLPHGL